MKFLYYIIPVDGEVTGTNDMDVAADKAKDEDIVVIYNQTGAVIRWNESIGAFNFDDIVEDGKGKEDEDEI